MTPLVSVVIPNYNYGRFLAEAIESVLGQTYPCVELLVVDDGSTDDSLEVVRRYGQRLRHFTQPRQGVSAARNRGIQESRGELVAFLDADDLWHPNKLSRQVELMRNPAVGMVCCGLEEIDEAGRTLRRNSLRRPDALLREIALLRWIYAGGGSAVLMRKACVERIGGFDPSLSTSADWDMWRRMVCHYEIAICPEPLALYRQHAGSMHRSVKAFERDMLRAFSKMFEDPAAAAVHGLRRQAYSNLCLMLSGSYLHAGQGKASVRYAWRSLTAWPPNVRVLAAVPIRRLCRWLAPQTAAKTPSVSYLHAD